VAVDREGRYCQLGGLRLPVCCRERARPSVQPGSARIAFDWFVRWGDGRVAAVGAIPPDGQVEPGERPGWRIGDAWATLTEDARRRRGAPAGRVRTLPLASRRCEAQIAPTRGRRFKGTRRADLAILWCPHARPRKPGTGRQRLGNDDPPTASADQSRNWNHWRTGRATSRPPQTGI
jgi:hypothetical protein